MIFSGLCFYTKFARDFSICLRTKWLWLSHVGKERCKKSETIGEITTSKFTTESAFENILGLLQLINILIASISHVTYWKTIFINLNQLLSMSILRKQKSIFSSSLFLDVTFCKAGFALTYILITYILKEYVNSLFIY